MRRLRRSALALAPLLVAAVVAGCGGGPSSDRELPDTSRSIVPRILVTVEDADTGTPIEGAMVRAVGRPVGGRTDADGRVALVAPIRAVTSGGQRFDSGAVRVTNGTARITAHDERRQSPQYGGGPRRTRQMDAVPVSPPLGSPEWTFDARTLVEFPPVVVNGLMAFGTNGGRVYALDAQTGAVQWEDKLDAQIASSPAIIDGVVYVAGMDGTLTAYRAEDGRRLWRHSPDGSPIETSPLVVDGLVYVGTWSGTFAAIDAETGRVRWSYDAPADIKGAAALADGNVVFGDYSGTVHALDARTGDTSWTFAGGSRFYGGPGVADGRIVIGDVGGAVYALDAQTGAELWRHSTDGAYVYASPALADGSAYIGAYDGRFMALDLSSGRVRWSYDLGGRISGSASVVDGVAYISRLYAPGEDRRTVGLRIEDGSVAHESGDGRYTPAVAGGSHLYLVGTRKIYAYAA